jgi:hypothetical protein
MAWLEQVNVWIGLDAGQKDHFAEIPRQRRGVDLRLRGGQRRGGAADAA